VEVGYRYRRSAWGRGLATEAATTLVRIAFADPATMAVVACALAGNARSLRVLEKLGLERVGEVMLSGTNEPTVKLALVK
jgi:RimJ/RimL family protein N-acetyltransferase